MELPKIAAAPLAAAAVGPISMDTLVAATASGIAQAPERVWYEPLELENAADSKERFDKPDYTETLREIVLSVLMSHGPIRDDVLVEKVAECHGFQRTGKNIRERILSVLPWTIATTETVGRFLWAATVPEGFIPFRHPRNDSRRRDVDEIPIQELIGLALELPALATSPDPALLLARALGVERLTGSVRERLTHAIEHSQALRRTSTE